MNNDSLDKNYLCIKEFAEFVGMTVSALRFYDNKKNGLIFTGPVYNTYLFDELSVVDPEQYLLQVSVVVLETRRVSSRRPKRHL